MRKLRLWILFSLTLPLILSALALPAKSQEEPSILWTRTFDGGSSDQARDVAIDSNDNIILTGISVIGTPQNYMTLKYDSYGNEIWNRTYGDGSLQARSVAIDSNDNIIVTGFRSDGFTDKFLTIKYDKNGNTLWDKTYGEEWQGEGVAVDSQDNVITVGYYYVLDMEQIWDIIIIKCDSNGNQIWSKTYDDQEGEHAFDIAIDSNDNILITGASYDGMTHNLIAIKYDKDGNLLWTKTYNGGYEDEGHGVAVDSMDNVIVTGFTSDTTNRYFLTIKYDADGKTIWTKTHRKENQDEAYSVAVDSKDNIVVTGWSFDGTTRDLTTIEYDKDGNQLWTTSHEGSPTYGSLVELRGYGVAVDSLDNIIVTGAIYYIIPQKLSDFLTIKYGRESFNLPPVVSDPSPFDGAEGVKVDLSMLSFNISDSESELMDYYVATDPDIGSVEGFNRGSGRYSIPLSGPLSYSTTYKWWVNVTDGFSWTNVTYSFTTEPKPVNLPPIVSDLSPPHGATGVPISLIEFSFNLTDPDGDLMSYAVTSDIGSDSGNNVPSGRYTVLVSGLDYETTYTWKVDVTDGTHWTNATFAFTTELEPQPIQYTLRIEVSGSGTTDPAPGTYHYDEGTKVSVTASADSGWMLGHWILNGTDVGKENPYIVTINANYNLTAIFVEASPVQHTLTIEVRGSGYTHPAVGSYLYDEGTSVSVTAFPKSGWMLSHWLLNGTDVGSADPYNVTMDANYNLTAVFVEIPPVQFPIWPLILLVFPVLIIVLIIYKRRMHKTPRV